MSMSSRTVKCLLFVWTLCLSLVISLSLHAQVTGATLSGTISDPQGGAIPNANISAKNVATGISTNSTTNASGAYSIPNLNPADYEVSVSAAGFNTAVAKVTLTVGAKQEMSISLTVGEVQQVVEVSGAAPVVETTNSTISSNVVAAQIGELPLNGRDWASLATLQPGIVSVRTQEVVTQVGSHARGLGLQLSIDGNRPTQNTYRLDGLIINDYSNAGPGSVLGQNLGVDAIEEFSVLTNNYSSEYGFTSGGVINAVTKSGSNAFHGSAYEFLRNSALDSATFIDNSTGTPKPTFRRNQFGGSAGGPILKDRIFIFGDYEGLRQSQGITNEAKVPSADARLGILNDGGPPVTSCPAGSSILKPGVSNTCVNNQIAKFFTFYPLPNAGLIGNGDTGFFAFAGQQVVPENYANTRGDIKVSKVDNLDINYYFDHSSFTQPDATNNVLVGFEVGRQGGDIEETHTFGPTMVNTIRFGYNRTFGFGETTFSAINPAAANTSFGIFPGSFAPRIIEPDLTTFTGGLNGESVQDYTNQTYQVFDDIARTVGNHSLKFGGSLIQYREDLFAPFIEDGSATFNSLQLLLQNSPRTVVGPINPANIQPHEILTTVPGVYFQDDWKLRSNLTINLGLRYEFETIPVEAHGLVQNLPTPETNPATGPFNHSFFTENPTTKNFEPRVGFAWDPFHDGKTAVRGGVGVFDALPLPYELAINNAQTSPFHVASQATGCAFASGQACVAVGDFPNGPSVAATLTNPPIANQAWNFVQPNPKRNYIYQWNLNVQRELPGNLVVTVAYAGSRGYHNPFQLDDYNTVFPILTSAGWIFPNPVNSGIPGGPACISECSSKINPNISAAGLIQTTLWDSRSWYNALEVNVEKRISHGFQVQGAFTWSKTEDTSSGSFAGDNFAGDVSPTVPWWDQRIVKGLSDFNVGRNLVINALWQVPTPASFRGPAGWIARNWQLSAIAAVSDGTPLWPLSAGGDLLGQGNSEPIAIPDVIPGCSLTNPSSGRTGSLQYINPNCFTNAVAPNQAFANANCDQGFFTRFKNANPTLPAPNPLTCINLLGNLGRNTVIGPGLFNVDYSMLKDNKIAKISESFDVQFRADFFNVFNRVNFNAPVDNLQPFDGTGASVGGFGQLDSVRPAREIQFAIKALW
jgi:hypothetical protein